MDGQGIHGRILFARDRWATASTRPTTARNLLAFDVETGRQLWKQNLGTVQKASAVFADGKIYAGTESGKFFILRPHADRCEVLSEVELPISDQGLASQKIPEPIVAGAAVARGRVYFVSSDTLYAIGPKKTHGRRRGSPSCQTMEPGAGRAGLGAGGRRPRWCSSPARQCNCTRASSMPQGRFLREDKAALVARSV